MKRPLPGILGRKSLSPSTVYTLRIVGFCVLQKKNPLCPWLTPVLRVPPIQQHYVISDKAANHKRLNQIFTARHPLISNLPYSFYRCLRPHPGSLCPPLHHRFIWTPPVSDVIFFFFSVYTKRGQRRNDDNLNRNCPPTADLPPAKQDVAPVWYRQPI